VAIFGSLEEECLTMRTVGLVTGLEPLANTSNVELHLASLALHLRQRLVNYLQYLHTDHAIFYTIHFLVDVVLPE